ncbi:DNA-directed RNA polymerase I subunit RPA1 [Phlebotomus argentipes]|uniref:DNA-directed RNA polymerase I subunit RPA1 n=1 Tax=Phlebotomus argentipes TaxID=94469 RepID=UPI00289373BC|nr:DNA-directed RNA polymerase I subunit RPA1 [Phlebotomus argentipes]
MIHFNRGGDSGTFHLDANELKFAAFTSEEVKKLSKVKIFTSQTIDRLGLAIPGGLYDRRMGPYDTDADPCQTCGRVFVQCEGHIGHIDLCMLVYNPIFIQTIYSLLRISCLSCFRLQLTDHVRSILELQLRLVDAGYIIEAQEIEYLKCEAAACAEGARVKLENGESLHPKIAELKELLDRSPVNHYHNKNTEELRLSIISTTLKMGLRKFCIHCKQGLKRIKYSYKTLMMSISKAEMMDFYKSQSDMLSFEEQQSRMKSSNKAILAEECRKYCREIYVNYPQFFLQLFPVLKNASSSVVTPFDIFFTDCIAVTPPKVRPAGKMNGRVIEHPQTEIYKSILTANVALKAILDFNTADRSANNKDIEFLYESSRGDNKYEKMYNAWRELQSHVDETLDITMSQNRQAMGMGLKQILEKKEGIIRMHMMGKRVNFAARTVITPDPNVDVEEIGVPELFAKKLTYPVPVTPWNIHDVRKYVMNGPDVYPGANFVEDERGKLLIPPNDAVRREAMAKLLTTPSVHHSLQVVHRHLLNNDVLLLNRQPTLHRPSIMAHKARILRGEKTFRLHYSNCKSYNADFDGDEMNAHCPQNEMGRSEAYNLVNVPNQYLVPKDGTPLGGLIQDHIISGVRLTMRGRFFTKEDYFQLIFQGLNRQRGDLIFLPPTILKPKILWSGKQVLSTIILNIIPRGKALLSLTSSSKINSKAWECAKPRTWKAGGTPLEDNSMSEAEVIIRQGELLVGILDKMHYGSTAYSLIHCMYELYGPEHSTRLLSAFARLFTYFLQWEGFTLGPKDIVVLPEADKQRAKIIKESRKIGNATAATALHLPEDIGEEELREKMDQAFHSDPKFRAIMDRQFKSALDQFNNNINKCCIPTGLVSKFPDNNLQLMVQSGAKGSAVNAMQISCLLGQIELEGKRPPLMVSGKALPSFPFFETSPKAGGFIDGRFLTGIQPQDFFFHCMAGREGLIDTAVKTSRSGYLQRCLIKHLEGLNVNYDQTVRDSDNSVVQFLYGEDGLDIAKSQFFKTKMLSFLDDNAQIIGDKRILSEVKNDDEMSEKLQKYVKSIKSWEKKNKDGAGKRRVSPFLNFSVQLKEAQPVKNGNKVKNGRRRADEKACRKWQAMTEEERMDYGGKATERCPDPIVSKFLPGSCFGSVTETMLKLIREYGRENPTRRKEFTEVMYLKAMQAVAPPGEPVGLLAAQSVGEPSTQMTLNTFHFAGRGEMNVTLGIPRLREILMLASKNIKTPSMDIPFKPHAKLESMAEKLRVKLGRVTVADVLESINVQSRLVLRPQRVWEYRLMFRFLPREAYKNDYCVKPKQILKYMSKSFFKLMFRGIVKLSQMKNSVIDFDEEKPKKSAQREKGDNEIDDAEPEEKTTGKSNSGEESTDDEGMDDADATDANRKNKQADQKDYDEPDDEEEKQDADADDQEMNEEEEKKLLEGKEEELQEDEEAATVIESNEFTEAYRYDKEHHLWCELVFHLPVKYKSLDLTAMLREVAKKAVIWQVPNINRAITYFQGDQLMLKTQGINIVEMFQYNKLLDLDGLYSNDIHAIAQTYGIEAAGRVIVKEVQNVFKVYGITVDPRHLFLISDYMTFNGSISALSRKGMENSASPLQQMSFESCMRFLKAATVSGCTDSLSSPSSRLMVGQPCKSGTGAFSLLNDNRMFLKNFTRKAAEQVSY